MQVDKKWYLGVYGLGARDKVYCTGELGRLVVSVSFYGGQKGVFIS